MEDRALGFAAAAHAQLADAPAGRSPTTATTRTGSWRSPSWSSSSSATPSTSTRPVRTRHHGHLGVAPCRAAGTWSRPTPGPGRRRRSSWPAAPSTAPRVPAVAASLPAALDQVTPLDYKRPDQLRPGRVLVVGASATGIQIADELLRSGREVTVAVGEHVRMPRTYRGRDIMWWLDQIGRLDERYDEVDDLVRARHVPSPQLVGTPERADLDLNALTARGADARRAARRGDRQHRLLLRLAAQRLQPRRPQAEPPARHDRRVGGGAGLDEGPDRARADPGRRAPARPDRPRRRGLRDGAVGHRVPRRLLVAGRAGARPQGRDPPRRRRGPATPRGSTGSGSTSCAAASPASSTAPRTTPGRSSSTWRAT